MEIQAIKPGDLLGKRYEVIESLGKGGMASVFKARDLITETILAVKVTAPDVIIKAQGQERFENEKDAFAQLSQNAYVVKLFDVIQMGNQWLIVLECVNGGTLKEKFAEFGAMSVEEIKFYFSGICKALKAAHDLNIVHRDIKPENVLLTKTGNIKLGDFGISVINGTGTEAERAIGTPKYMAPEVVLSMLATPQSDIYSLGIMMYEFSVGSPPFLTSDAKKLATRQIDWKPIRPKTLNPQIPQKLENIILKMIEKDPKNRYQTIDEVYQELISVDNSENIKPYLYHTKWKKIGNSKSGTKRIFNNYDALPKTARTKWSLFMTLSLMMLILLVVVLLVLV